MFAIFSQIQGTPTIHQIHKSEMKAKQALINIVSKCISEKSDNKIVVPLTLPLDQIKLETFQEYPAYTYLSVDDNTIDIYQHLIVEKVDKGWVWNGTIKSIDSKKIGVFQILPVIDPMSEEEFIKYKNESFMTQMENVIDHLIDDIEQANNELNKEIEDIKRFHMNVQKIMDTPSIFDYETNIHDDLSEYEDILLTSPSKTTLDGEYPHQPTTKTCSINDGTCGVTNPDVPVLDRKDDKTNLIDFQNKYLSSLDYLEETTETKENDEVNSSATIHRCRSNRRGIRYGRSNYNSRRMRLRAY